MPGHMLYALREHPDLQVVDRNGNRNARNLDPTNPAARAFVKELLDEVVPLFDGRYVHTGGDEFTSDWNAYPVLTEWAQQRFGPEANAHDAVIDFTNFVDGVIRSHGKTMRTWNDAAQGGSVVEANRDIVLEYWSIQHGSVRAQEFLDAGYRLVNANRDILYDVPSLTPSYNNVDPRVIYDVWDMSQWHGALGPNLTDPHDPGILGGQLHLWNDRPTAMTEDQEAGRLSMPLRAMAEQLWGSARAPGSWDELAANAFTVGHEPQWAQSLADASGDLALDQLAWSSTRERRDCHEAALVDGDDTTRWCGPKTGPQTVVVDLGRAVDLGTLVLRWETAFAKSYALEVSDDLKTWRSLYDTTSSDGGVDVLPVEGRGRYLRLAMTERGTAYGYSLYEIEAFGPDSLVPAEFSVEVDPDAVLVEADRPGQASVTVHNSSAEDVALTWEADPSEGFAVEPATGVLRVPAGGSRSAAFEVTTQRDAGAGSVRVRVTGRSGAEQVELGSADLSASVPQAALFDAFTNVATTSDDDIDPAGLGAGFDGAGSSYSAQALADEGLTPGGAVTAGGVDLVWPDVAAGEPNNVLADGQSFLLRGQGSTVGVLAASTYGALSKDWVVHYADGTSQTVRETSPDWSSTPPAGSTLVADMPYRNNVDTGRTARRTMVFLLRLPVDATKQVEAVTLPVVSSDAVRGAPALHVFALGIG
jgi:hexosaminidase